MKQSNPVRPKEGQGDGGKEKRVKESGEGGSDGKELQTKMEMRSCCSQTNAPLLWQSRLRRINHFFPQFTSALFPLHQVEKYTSNYLLRFLVQILRRPYHSALAINIFSGWKRSGAAFPAPIIAPIQFTAGYTFIRMVGRKQDWACYITSSNNQAVRWSKQNYSVDDSVECLMFPVIIISAHTKEPKTETNPRTRNSIWFKYGI